MSTAYARARTEPYENSNVIKWILDPMRLRAMFEWWDAFVEQQEQYRQMYRDRDLAGQFDRSLTLTKGGFGLHYYRIPVKIDEILIKLDPELDGRNMKKMNRFLRDFPVFDLRIKKQR